MSNSNKSSYNKRPPMGQRPMGRGPGMDIMPGQKAKDLGGSLKRLIKYLGRYRGVIIFAWILAIGSTALNVIGPKILSLATDELYNGITRKMLGEGNIDFGKIGQIILTLLALYITGTASSFLQGFLMAGASMKVSYRLRNDMLNKINRLPFKYFDGTSHGDVLSRITNDVDTINQSLTQSLTQLITSIATIVGIVIIMVTISWQMTIAALMVLPISGLAVTAVIKKSQNHFISQQKYLGEVNGLAEEMFGSHIIVKAFNGAPNAAKLFEASNNTLYQSAWKANFLSGLIMPITVFIGNLTYVVICILGGYFTIIGKMSVGGIQAFIQYVRLFNHPISMVANISNIIQQTAAAAERVFEFLDQPEEEADSPEALTVARNHSPTVNFKNVSFGYDPDKIIINDFSTSVNPGEKIAIVGPTGAGKTTIVKLLMRFYDVNKGSINLDGQDIRLFARDSLRTMFGMVLQDTWLFNGSIADNIRYGNSHATPEQIEQAAKAAQADHFIRTLSDGYDTIINEEADNISAGQKQLLTIARAILSDPDILILDEATSSVDTRTEILIQRAMDNLIKGRTSFIIAHRLSTIRNADLILVMSNGNIVEQGTHQDLMDTNGVYAALYRSQFE